MTENRFTVPLKYSLSHSKIQCDGTPLTNDELVRILNTNDGAFLKNFKLKKEINELKEERKGFESCSHNWGLLYDEAKNKVEELSKENQELKKQLILAKPLYSRRELERENKELKQENEALKKFVKVNFSDMMAEKMEKELE